MGYRVGSAALVTPTRGTLHLQKNIWRRYFIDLHWIRTGSVQHPPLIPIAAEADAPRIPTSFKGEHHEQTEIGARRQQDSAREAAILHRSDHSR